MANNKQYINLLLSIFFVVMVLFMLFAKQMLIKINIKQQETILQKQE